MVDAKALSVRGALKHNFLFGSFTDPELDALANEAWLESIPAGSVIVREGDDADALYVVVSGGVNVTKATGQFLAFLGPGGFFGEMALFLEGARRSATCTTTMDTTCAVVRKDILDQFCDQRPALGVKIYRSIIRTLAERLQSTSADLAFLMSVRVRKQAEVSAVVEQAKEKTKPPAGVPPSV